LSKKEREERREREEEEAGGEGGGEDASRFFKASFLTHGFHCHITLTRCVYGL
jgi:hypothetical protein